MLSIKVRTLSRNRPKIIFLKRKYINLSQPITGLQTLGIVRVMPPDQKQTDQKIAEYSTTSMLDLYPCRVAAEHHGFSPVGEWALEAILINYR